MELVKRFIELKDQIDEAEASLKSLREEKDRLEAQLVDHYVDNGLQSVNMDGRLVYLTNTVYAELPQGTEAAIRVLQASDYRDLVKPNVNRQSLSALVRELKEQGTIPESFEGVIQAGERPGIRVRKA